MVYDKYYNVELEDIQDLLLDEKEIRQLILNLVSKRVGSNVTGWNFDHKNFHRRRRCYWGGTGSGERN